MFAAKYTFEQTLSDHAELYRKNTGAKLIKITSYRRSDHVFRLCIGNSPVPLFAAQGKNFKK